RDEARLTPPPPPEEDAVKGRRNGLDDGRTERGGELFAHRPDGVMRHAVLPFCHWLLPSPVFLDDLYITINPAICQAEIS
ncbi:MAG: hypothetical protein II909_04855, partial [Kiritimatiellae bacterium]|nr:hypothetical protein [Kiritimatiellia bacterium]